jgi:hypothetical protein
VIIYIEEFFTDGRDFACYIIGRTHVTAFTKGVYNMQVYNGPIKASPMMSYNSEILKEEHVYEIVGGPVEKSDRPLEKVKWKYLFATAIVAWCKLIFHPRKLELIRKRNDRLLQYKKEKAIGAENSDCKLQAYVSNTSGLR